MKLRERKRERERERERNLLENMVEYKYKARPKRKKIQWSQNAEIDFKFSEQKKLLAYERH